ncbi:MAG: hypothetical protein ACRC1K_26925 [Planctomycetia bacterium]
MNDVLIWLHDDDLNPRSPVFRRHPDRPAVYVFDEEWITEEKISLKRIQFLYECVLELPTVIRRGNVAEEVIQAAERFDCRRVVAAASPDPRNERWRRKIATVLPVEIVEPEPFVPLPNDDFDLRRFSRYWRSAERFAFKPTETKK